MRLVACLVLLGGCRQILSFDDVTVTRDAAIVDGTVDADRSARKKQITIDSTKVAEKLARFAVWVVLADADIAARAALDGSDIYFTRTDGTPLAYELQRWTPSTGAMEAWVTLDLDATVETMFELHYGEGGTPHPADAAEVFANGFAAVWHLEDAGPTILDATGSRDGTALNMDSTARIPARLGNGLRFDGVDDQIDFVNPLAGNVQHTISAWVDQRVPTDFDSILTVGNAVNNQSRWFHARYTNDLVAVGFYNNDFDDVNVTIVNTGPTLLHWVFEGANRTSRLYRDGVFVKQKTHAAGINTLGTAGYIGFAPFAWGPMCHLNGTLDEVRIATVARSAGYIATEFANQSSPQTFYVVGPELVP